MFTSFIATDEGQDGGHWVKRGNLVDSRSSIVDVKFAPRHHGLKLVCYSLFLYIIIC